MSLRSKIVLILVAVVGGYALTTDQIQRRIFSTRFADIERQGAVEDVERVIEALHGEIRDVDQLSLEWATWDDAWAYMQGERVDAFERSSLSPMRLASQKIDVLFFLRNEDGQSQHEIVWARSVDPDSGQAIALRELNHAWDAIPSRNPLLARDAWNEIMQSEGSVQGDLRDRPVGILLTEHKPLIVSGRPILRSDGDSEPAGMLILGRFLGSGLDADLTEQTRVDFDIWQIDGRHEVVEEAAAIHDAVASSAEHQVREDSPELLHAWATFQDIRNRPELLLRANVRRDVTAAGSTAIRFGLISTLAGGLVMLLALMMLLQRIVIAPLTRLTAHAVSIGQNEDFRLKLGMEREDELGTLAGEFDSMMDKLEHARAQLVDTARTAGMSEIATGILHNVGNVLNSVNISASLVSQKVEGMSVKDLQRVSDILESHADNLGTFIAEDPKGKHLQPFLSALSLQIGEEQRFISAELGSLTDGIEHICELIKSQQQFAVKTELVEEINLADKLDEAVRITDQALGKDHGMRLVCEFEDLPEITLDKHRLLEIIVNLIQNARQAMAGLQPRVLTLRLRHHGEDKVRIEVSDTGTGIEAEAAAKVFNLGFTTKADGHGYGLHTAANAATEMGGHLTAESEGQGHGATFVLELPLRLPAHAGAQS